MLYAASQSTRSWLKNVYDDVRHIANFNDSFEIYRDVTLQQFFKMSLAAPTRLENAFRQFLVSNDWQHESYWAPTKAVKQIYEDTVVVCNVCGYHASSPAALASHRHVVHGTRSLMWSYVDTPWCPCCLTYFWNEERVVKHLRERHDGLNVCRLLVLANFHELSSDTQVNVLQQAKANAQRLKKRNKRREYAELPSTDAFGPVPLFASEVVHLRRFQDP